jgi:predicted O-methyltransferase YrrM
MNTLDYIMKKYNVSPDDKSPRKLNIKKYDLAILFRELGFKIGVEIGVDMGHYSEQLCMLNPELKLYSVDPWEGEYKTHYEEAKKRLTPYNCEIMIDKSMDVVRKFEDNSIDFVYIDGDHSFKGVTEDLTEWTKKVKPGGIVSGHDYLTLKHNETGQEVKRAIDLYIAEHNIKMLFRVHRNYQSSWFFVK